MNTMKTNDDSAADTMAEAVAKWRKLTSLYTLVTTVQGELPPEVNERLDPWMQAVATMREASAARHAVLAPQESEAMCNWLRAICGDALHDSAATVH